MSTKKWVALFCLPAVLAMVLTACKKDSSNDNKNGAAIDSTAAKNNFVAESAFDNATLWADQAMAGHMLKTTLTDTVYMGTCVLATLDLTALPYTLTIDFGQTSCLCDDGKYRRGKIFVHFNGGYWTPGTVITYTFENYFINENQLLGTKTVTNMGRNSLQHLWWQTVVNGSVVFAGNAGTFTWNSNREHEWSEGEATPALWWDDVYLVTGSASGVNTNGKTYTITIVSPLRKKLNCEWLQSGTLNIQVQDLPLVVFDYGNGTCDALATATVNGQVYTVTLP